MDNGLDRALELFFGQVQRETRIARERSRGQFSTAAAEADAMREIYLLVDSIESLWPELRTSARQSVWRPLPPREKRSEGDVNDGGVPVVASAVAADPCGAVFQYIPRRSNAPLSCVLPLGHDGPHSEHKP